MGYHTIQYSLNGGEVSRQFAARADHQRDIASCALLENFKVHPLGGVTRMDGSRFIALAKGTTPIRLVRFEFSVTQAYALEFGPGYIRFLKERGRLEVAGTPVEVATPYAGQHLYQLQFVPSADVLYIVHGSYPVQKLIRLSDTQWILRPVEFFPPPSVESDTQLNTALTLSAVSGLAVTATAGAAVFLDGDVDRMLHVVDATLGAVQGVAVMTALVGSSPTAQITLNILHPFPTTTLPAGSWTLQGSPAASLTPSKSTPQGAQCTLQLARVSGTSPNLVTNGDFAAGTANWTNKSTGTGTFTAPEGLAILKGGTGPGVGWAQQLITTVPTKKYHISFDVVDAPLSCQIGSTDGGVELFAEKSFDVGNARSVDVTATGTGIYLQFRNNQNTTPSLDNVTLTLSSAQGFRSADVGKYVKLNKGIVQITSLTDSTEAVGIIQEMLENTQTSASGGWSLEEAAWSGARGYPKAASFFQERLALAGNAADPNTVRLSRTSHYENFATSSLDDASLEYALSSNEMNQIEWLEPFGGLFVGTAKSEQALIGTNGQLTPSNVEQVPQTTLGTAPIRPLGVESILLLVQRGGRRLWELDFNGTDVSLARARAKDLTITAEHITSSGITQLDYQRSPFGTLWLVRADGQLAVLVYNYFEQIVAWSRKVTQGQVTSLCVTPIAVPTTEQTEDVWISVLRTIGGVQVQTIEVLDSTLQVDCGLSYSGPPVTTLSGLAHLEGQLVTIVGDNAVYPAQVVSGGSVTLSQAVETAQVGLPFTPRLRTLRPEIPSQQGTIQARKKRWLSITARCLDTSSLQINGKDVPQRRPSDLMDRGLTPSDIDLRNLQMGWTTEGSLTIEQPLPLPCTILSLSGNLEVEDA